MDVVQGHSILLQDSSVSVRYTLSGMLVSEVSRVIKYLKTSNNIFKNYINEVIYKTETVSQTSKKIK